MRKVDYLLSRLTLLVPLAFAIALAGGCASRGAATQDQGAAQNSFNPQAMPTGAGAASAANQPVTGLGAAPSGPAPPADATGPATANYRIAPNDLLEIQVLNAPELNGVRRVNVEGFITLPLIDPVKAVGLTSEELEQAIADKLGKDYLQEPQVSVFIKEYMGQRVTVEGAVQRPGIYPLTGETSLLQAIALASGLAPLAEPDNVLVYRLQPNGQKAVYTYDLDRIRSGEIKDPPVTGNDIVVVQRSGAREFVADSLFSDIIKLIIPFRWWY